MITGFECFYSKPEALPFTALSLQRPGGPIGSYLLPCPATHTHLHSSQVPWPLSGIPETCQTRWCLEALVLTVPSACNALAPGMLESFQMSPS